MKMMKSSGNIFLVLLMMLPLSVVAQPDESTRQGHQRMSCTSIMVGRKASTDGSVMTSHTCDSSFEPTKHYFLCGNGSNKCRATLEGDNVTFVDGIYTTAKTIGDIASEMYDRQEFADVAYFEPFYLKEFQATTPKKLL